MNGNQLFSYKLEGTYIPRLLVKSTFLQAKSQWPRIAQRVWVWSSPNAAWFLALDHGDVLIGDHPGVAVWLQIMAISHGDE